mmetsp:Transcript_6985/g.16287  ORF Transcript_6985/g.16287 Transcript_6985/m.16287 type:complete len:236 (+) Transcript_6985:44-751(+)
MTLHSGLESGSIYRIYWHSSQFLWLSVLKRQKHLLKLPKAWTTFTACETNTANFTNAAPLSLTNLPSLMTALIVVPAFSIVSSFLRSPTLSAKPTAPNGFTAIEATDVRTEKTPMTISPIIHFLTSLCSSASFSFIFFSIRSMPFVATSTASSAQSSFCASCLSSSFSSSSSASTCESSFSAPLKKACMMFSYCSCFLTLSSKVVKLWTYFWIAPWYAWLLKWVIGSGSPFIGLG